MVGSLIRQSAVAREQDSVQRCGQRYIDGVVSCDVVPQLPHARQQKIMSVSLQPKISQIGERSRTTPRVYVSPQRVFTYDLRHFDVEQMWHMQRLARCEQVAFNRMC